MEMPKETVKETQSLQVGKWGNSLAVRLPAAMLREAGLQEGSQVLAVLDKNRVISLKPMPNTSSLATSRAALIAEIQAVQQGMEVSDSVVREMRDARY